MIAINCRNRTSTYCACSYHNSDISNTGIIVIHSPVCSTQASLDKKLREFQTDVERVTVKSENKKRFSTWVGTKNGRPYHLKKWYR
jgi:hypothetical protein